MNLTTERAASNFEKYYYFRRELQVYNNFALISTYTKPISTYQLSKALRQIILENSCFTLNYSLVDDKNKEDIKLRVLNKINFEDVVIYNNKYDRVCKELLSDLHESMWFEQGVQEPLWKVVVMKDKKTIAFVVHHGLFDGESTVQFHLRLLELLNEEPYNDNGDFIKELFDMKDDSSKINILPPSEKLINHSPSWSHILRTMYNNFICPKIMPRFSNFVEFEYAKPPYVPPKTVYSLVNISSETSALVSKKCHELGISMTVWILLSMQYSLRDTLSKKEVCSNIAVNLRSLLPDRKHPFGLFVCGYNTILAGTARKEIDTADVMIYEAKLQTKKLKHEIAKKDRMEGVQDIGMMNYISSICEYLSEKSSNSRSSILDISNLGLRKFKNQHSTGEADTKHNNIEDLHFTSAMNSVAGLFSLNCIATDIGGMNFNFLTESGLEDSVAEFEANFAETFSCLSKIDDCT